MDALSLWALDRQTMAAALLRRDDALWRELDGIGFDTAVKVVARVTMLDPAAEPPMVRLEAILQRGWLRGAAAPAGGKAKH